MLYYSQNKQYIHTLTEPKKRKHTVMGNPKEQTVPQAGVAQLQSLIQPMKQIKNTNSVSYANSKKLILNARVSATIY